MIITPHVVLSLLIAEKINDPILAPICAIVGHYFLDLIPHEAKEDLVYPLPRNEEEKEKLKVLRKRLWKISFYDGIITILILLNFFQTKNNISFYFLSVIFFGVLPDLINILGMFFPNKLFHFFATFHHSFHLVFKIYPNKYLSYLLQYLISFGLYFFIV